MTYKKYKGWMEVISCFFAFQYNLTKNHTRILHHDHTNRDGIFISIEKGVHKM